MKKTLRIVGQVLLAIGVTLAIGGVASFFVGNVELRFLGNIVAGDAGRVVWVEVNVLVVGVGFYLWRSSRPSDVIA